MTRLMLKYFSSVVKSVSLRSKSTITTPIFYVNADPHLGHLYTAVMADALARFFRLCGSSVRFVTGTDEHGMKVQRAASVAELPPIEWCNQISQAYKDLFQQCSISFTDFIRTTEERHMVAVDSFWKALCRNDTIYKGQYEGWYCVSEETFIPESRTHTTPSFSGVEIRVSSDSGNIVEWMEEENYMFKLSSFQKDLQNWIEKDVVKPSVYQNILQRWLKEDLHLQDISVSRPRDRLPWGIIVPTDDSQTVYVWLDALINYLTASGYPRNLHSWPPHTQIIGKDILKFHGIYWPAFLMAAGLDPPTSIVCHSHWTVDGEKMSKSKKNVVRPEPLMQEMESDALRYFLLAEGVPHSDGNFSIEKMRRLLNAELADTLGNLLSRCTAPSINKSQKFITPTSEHWEQYATTDAKDMIEAATMLPYEVGSDFTECNFYKGIQKTMDVVRQCNSYVQARAPWDLQKNGKVEELEIVLFTSMEVLRVVGILLQPIVPNICKRLLDKLGVPPAKRQWGDAKDKGKSKRFLDKERTVLFQKIKYSE